MEDFGELTCDFCNFVCREGESDLFFKDLIKFHSNFTVYCASCPRSFRKVNSLQKHNYREHKNVEQEIICGEGAYREHEPGTEDTYDHDVAQKEFQHHVAKFLLSPNKIKCWFQVSDRPVENTTDHKHFIDIFFLVFLHFCDFTQRTEE